jgi:hypothetical protein
MISKTRKHGSLILDLRGDPGGSDPSPFEARVRRTSEELRRICVCVEFQGLRQATSCASPLPGLELKDLLKRCLGFAGQPKRLSVRGSREALRYSE